MRFPRDREQIREIRPIHASVLILIAVIGFGCRADHDEARVAFRATTPSASFSQDRTSGTPGVAIRFDDTSIGEITSRSWDFGALGTSSDASPVVVFPDVGTYDVALTVSGPRGMSRVVKEALIEVGIPPTAGFSCGSTKGFAPFTVSCVDESMDASRIRWDFGDGSSSTDPAPQHVYQTPGVYTLEQIVTSGGGEDRTSITIDVLPFDILVSPASGTAPVDVTFTGVTGGESGLAIWTIDGQIVSSSSILRHRFDNPGTFLVAFAFGVPGTSISAQRTIEYVVGYGPATAAFRPSTPGGNGPLEVVLLDESSGAIDRWEWDFGDGSRCVYPAPANPDPNDPVDVCDASSPRHVYENVGNYDVSLQITGPGPNAGDPPIVSSTMMNNAVRVHLRDPSFELQTADTAIGNGWTSLRPVDETQSALHVALSSAQGTDAGMPTDGTQWAVLDGLGTDGTTGVDVIENGIRQDFLKPSIDSVIEFDYVLLYSEPPASPVLDAVTATVSDGTTTVEIPSARADVSAAYAGASVRFPTRDGSTVRVTPVLTASLDLAKAFPTATDETLFTLTIRTSNATNGLRSPRVYVDHIRFTKPAAGTLTANFILETDPIIAGSPALFTDDSCPNPITAGCVEPTSWRWDFDTHLLPTPPLSSGSGEQNPSYVFPEAGTYDVKLKARFADLESETSMRVSVIEGPVAAFGFDPPGPHVAPATLVFSDLSTSDASDPIVDWSWDFGGWGVSSLQNPAAVTIGQAGDWIITLTITTASGQTDTIQTTITVE